MAQTQTETIRPFDTQAEVSLPTERAREALREGYSRPFLLVDPAIIREKYRRFVAAMPQVRVHYAVKANPDPRIVQLLAAEGSAFEMASAAELDALLLAGGSAEETQYSNPVKPLATIEYAARHGVKWYSLDNVEELEKIVRVVPRAKLSLRIDVPDAGSDFPLSSKFGARSDEVDEIVQAAAALGADLCGLTFHVGSQCRNVQNWPMAVNKAQSVFARMRETGFTPQRLNIGGGFPVQYGEPVPDIETIGDAVNKAIADLSPDITVIAEPGRYLVADSACLVCQVIGKAKRDGQRWLYLDTGIFGGLFESFQGLKYTLASDRSGQAVPWQVAGPTCDSDDMLNNTQMLPEDLQTGDRIYIHNAGAYTTAYASGFNGFPLPEVKML